MYSKKILVVIPVIMIPVFIGIVYLDSLERSGKVDGDFGQTDRHHSHERSHARDPGPEDLERILQIEQQLEDLDNKNLSIAFYGELIRIYMDNGRLDGAAEAAGRMAELTGEFRDWKNAGDWYHEWMLKESDQEFIRYFSQKSVDMYKKALILDPAHPGVRTDLAVELIRLGKPEEAIVNLKKALAEFPDYLNANYNLGVILYQTGNKDKSISYLKRSLELAAGTEHEDMVREFFQQSEIQNL